MLQVRNLHLQTTFGNICTQSKQKTLLCSKVFEILLFDETYGLLKEKYMRIDMAIVGIGSGEVTSLSGLNV